MLRQYELVDLVKSYDPVADEDLLNRAYVFAMKAHGNQTRLSGDPYFSHPIEVAGILTQLKLDAQTIVTALLHDTIEDTETTYEEINYHFGREIADLVEGVTKLSNIHFTDKQAKQAENFRKFFLATSKDVRVLLVKLADRLHNMRTITHHPNEVKRLAIAQETMEIYAPLAGRIGMQGFRDEFEDRSFMVLNADARESVVNRLNFLQKQSGDSSKRIKEVIQTSLAREGIDALVYGRFKRPYSVWCKMERKAISFEQLSDIIGFRVIVDTKPDCYRVLGVVHSQWKMVPERFRDYISTPKRNGYQSIHTTVIGPDDQRVELQVRTKDMHEVAETGVAAHWNYKEATYQIGTDKGKGRKENGAEDSSGTLRESLFRDLKGLADLFEGDESSADFLEHTKMEMYSDHVFVFSPKGDLISLPRGSTPIDFAYAVHTTIGDTCVGAKINGHHRPLRTALQNGDSVEILCSKAQGPTPDWESMVVTGRARSAIRRSVKQRRREDFIDLGKKIVESAFSRQDLNCSESALNEALPRLKINSLDDLYTDIGASLVPIEDVVSAVYPSMKNKLFKRKTGKKRKAIGPDESAPAHSGVSIPLEGLTPGLAVHLAPCCHPLPGDRIVGVTSSGKGIEVHTIDCIHLEEGKDDWLDLRWQDNPGEEFSAIGRIEMTVTNEPGALGEIAGIIARLNGNITNVRFLDQDDYYARLDVDIAVDDVKHLLAIISALRATSVVNEVERKRATQLLPGIESA